MDGAAAGGEGGGGKERGDQNGRKGTKHIMGFVRHTGCMPDEARDGRNVALK